MNQRERFLSTLRFEETDRPFFMPTIGFWRETIERWKGEGLPRFASHELAALLYFGFDLWIPLPVGTAEQPGLFPPFLPKVIKKDEKYRIVRDFAGKTYKEFIDGSATVPLYMESPVKDMDDFRELRWRLRPGFPGRCVNPVFDGLYGFAKLNGQSVGTMFSGLFGFHRHLMGDEELMLAYFDQPELVHEMSKAWLKLVRGVTRVQKKRYGIDFVTFWEDMCFVNGPLVSPRIFREFMTPYYRAAIDDAKNQGIEFFFVDTDGDCSIVIPLFREVGINMMFPFEVQSGMDVRKVREEHSSLAIFGGLDKRALENGKEEIEEEVMAKVPPMLAKGGYIPSLDHTVHPDVPLENFRYFMRLLRSRRIRCMI